MTVTVTAKPPRDWQPRHTATSLLAVLFAAATAVASFGLPAALTGWTTGGEELALRTHYVIWGALAGIFLPGAALALLKRSVVAPAQQLAAFVVAALASLVLAAEPENIRYVAIFTVPVIVLLLLHSDRAALRSHARPHRGMLVLALAAAGPGLGYAISNLRLSAATPFTDDLHGGYMQAAILAISLVLSTAVSAYGARGWQITAACTATAAAMLGLAGLLFPTDPSSVGQASGAALLGAATMLVIMSVQRHRDQTTRTSSNV